jgi:hypothetical protein
MRVLLQVARGAVKTLCFRAGGHADTQQRWNALVISADTSS